MNVLLQCARRGIPIVETPIRTLYLDKENSGSHFHPLRDSVKILSTILKFASSSLASFALDYLLFMVLAAATRRLAFGLVCSNVAARIGSGLFNYLLNRHLVFQGRQGVRHPLAGYLLLAAGILAANNVLLSLFAYGLALPAWLAKLLTELSLFLVSLTVQARVIFHKGTAACGNAGKGGPRHGTDGSARVA